MRFYYIALFMFLFMVSLSTLSELQVFEASTTVEESQDWIKAVEDLKNWKPNIKDMVASFIQGAKKFIEVMFYAVVGAYPLFIALGLPDSLATMLSLPIYLTYGAAVIQVLTGRWIESRD